MQHRQRPAEIHTKHTADTRASRLRRSVEEPVRRLNEVADRRREPVEIVDHRVGAVRGQAKNAALSRRSARRHRPVEISIRRLHHRARRRRPSPLRTVMELHEIRPIRRHAEKSPPQHRVRAHETDARRRSINQAITPQRRAVGECADRAARQFERSPRPPIQRHLPEPRRPVAPQHPNRPRLHLQQRPRELRSCPRARQLKHHRKPVVRVQLKQRPVWIARSARVALRDSIKKAVPYIDQTRVRPGPRRRRIETTQRSKNARRRNLERRALVIRPALLRRAIKMPARSHRHTARRIFAQRAIVGK